jgi:hypothetical protein
MVLRTRSEDGTPPMTAKYHINGKSERFDLSLDIKPGRTP